MDISSHLNTAQREAVETIEGPVLILAGPGSGKTRVITHRIAYLIKTCGISPYRIMAVTFTNKAAREMQDRLNTMLASSVENLTIGTFHAICAKILRRDGKAIGVQPGFIIYDEEDQANLIKRSLQELNLDPKKYVPRAILSAISAAKSRLQGSEYFLNGSRSYFDEVVGRVYQRYQELLAQSQALDFDDLLMTAVMLFRKNPDVLEKYQDRYVHVIVDEFQDTNNVQYEFIKLIGGKYRNICAVGDPDQSIYSWRFADVRNILNFEKDFPDAKVITLEQNYRSTKRILDTASCVIRANQQRKPKNLWTENEEGDPVTLMEAYTEQEEAQFVVREIERLIDSGEAKAGDCAVMYRTNAQSRVIEEAFIRYGLPYKLIAGTRFYERKEIKDIVAYLRIIQNPLDSISLMRIINVPGRGIGQHSLDELASWANSQRISHYEALQRLADSEADLSKLPFSPRVAKTLGSFGTLLRELIEKSKELKLLDFFDFLVTRSGYRDYVLNGDNGDERWDNVLELRTVAEEFNTLPPQEGLTAFLENVALVSDVDNFKESDDKVTLITLHQAKGLEFGVVFIVGVEEGLLPHFKSLDDPYQMEEERRLCYVGITRARRKVYLVHAFRRNLMGRSTVNKPSRFLQDIPRELMTGGEIWRAEESKIGMGVVTERANAAKNIPIASLPELKSGDKVRHSQFGEGVVVSSMPRGNDYEVVVAFTGVGLKKLLQSFARLEKIS
ncbi:MAG: UvrD-helicase domain-containing protein [Dehalococcoidales bacterium]|jgi:DNA helicase-2/ATP-dependent DNA helicase PcrA|nr:UvrD-helicase domain-containing protein [Dehalococcoidales bacterium]